MNAKLFRSAEFYQRRYHTPITLLILPLMGLILSLLLFSFLGVKEITISSMGEVVPVHVLDQVQSTSEHPIIKNLMEDNQAVKKGDLLLEYEGQTEQVQQGSLQEQLDLSQGQLKELKKLEISLKDGKSHFESTDHLGYQHTFEQFQSQSRDIELGIAKSNTEVSNQASIAGNTIHAIDQQLGKLEEDKKDYQEIADAITNGASVTESNPYRPLYQQYQEEAGENPALKNQYLSQIRSTISGLESSISNLEIQRASTGSVASYDTSLSTKIESLRQQFLQETAKQIATIEAQITSLKAQVSQAQQQVNRSILYAGATGILHLNPEIKGKNLIPVGTEVASIYPDIRQEAEVAISSYFSSKDIPTIQKGQTVRLSLSKVGKDEIRLSGTVTSIDQSPTITKEGNLFKVTAIVRLSAKEKTMIKYGLQGRVTCVVGKKTYFDYYKDKLLRGEE